MITECNEWGKGRLVLVPLPLAACNRRIVKWNCLPAGWNIFQLSYFGALICFSTPTITISFIQITLSYATKEPTHTSPGSAACWKPLVPSSTYSTSLSISSNMDPLCLLTFIVSSFSPPSQSPLGIAQSLWILAGHAPVVSLYGRLVMP